jgi:O-antigen/teichoic acid export membrane protein
VTESLRVRAARGTIVNAAFLVFLSLLGLVRGLLLGRLVGVEDYGLWGILITAFGTLLWLKQAGISDRYVQQDDADQERAFQQAFSLELLWTGVFVVLVAGAIPVVAAAYGEPDLLAPGFVGLLALPALALQAPLWIHYRRLDFVRQRLLQAADPVVGFVVSIALAAAGAGVWAFVVGLTAGAWAAALAAVLSSPYRLRWRFSRGALRSYASFSWPLVAAGATGVVIAQGSIAAAAAYGGIAAAGAVALAATVTQFTDRLDQVITGTLYPVVARVKDRRDLMLEAFLTSNRLALMWAVPFGIGLALFADVLVVDLLGERWRPAIPLLQWFGVIAALNHLGFNWQAFFRATGDTKPIALAGLAAVIAFLAAALPLTAAYGLEGLAAGLGIQMVVLLVVRTAFLRRLFPLGVLGRHALRSLAPVVPGALLVLALDAPDAVEVALFCLLAAALTVWVERRLLRDVLRLLRSRAA